MFYYISLHSTWGGLGKILNPKLLLMCWSAPCMAVTAIRV